MEENRCTCPLLRGLEELWKRMHGNVSSGVVASPVSVLSQLKHPLVGADRASEDSEEGASLKSPRQ